MIHLHARSAYTLLNSTLTISKLVRTNKEMGFDAVCLSDKHVMYGAMEFKKACAKANIKPLYGLVVDVMYQQKVTSFELIAKNNNGFKKLMKLSTYLSDNDYLSLTQLQDACNDCVLIVFCEGGFLEESLIKEDLDSLEDEIKMLNNDFKELYFGLSYQESSFWAIRNKYVYNIASKYNLKCVALNKIYYATSDDEISYKVIRGIKENKTINDPSLALIKSRYIKSEEEMASIYSLELLANTDLIKDMCNVDLAFTKASIPTFTKTHGMDSATYLQQLCAFGLKKRLHNKLDQTYITRLNYELSVIHKMHFEDYFLIVYDFILFAKKNGINVGPGRGSAAGSLVSYCLGITNIDPLRYNLLFERFLNPERITMPDIDTDFPDDRRDEVIDYVYQTYGSKHVANIVTFGTLGAKQVVKDVARVLNIPNYEVDKISKLIPNAPKMTLARAFELSPRLKDVVNSDVRFQNLMKLAFKLEGLPRHTSIHAGGIVLCNEDINDIIPTSSLSDDRLCTQYSMDHLEELGLIKMDFLSLRNLTIIDEIVKIIHQEDLSFDLNTISLKDQTTYSLIRQVDTVGVFQLESDGMRKLLRKMKPNSFEEIAATIALFRPGPMDNINVYLENKQNPYQIKYPHKVLEPILKETYGVMIYQEQIMQVAKVMAGFSLGKADILRKAIAKKQEHLLLSLENDFIKGCLANGYSDEEASLVYDLIKKFAGYGFNKAHSIAYGMICYQMAYLKANYPKPFYACLLSSVIGNNSKTSEYLDECYKKNINILYPSVIHPTNNFEIEADGIRYPLSAIRMISSRLVDNIISENEREIFKDFYDFVARMSIYKVTSKQFESMINAGALDCFNFSRASLLNALSDAISYSELVKIVNAEGVFIDTSLVSKPLILNIKDDKLTKSVKEKEALGLNLGANPIIEIKLKNNINVEVLSKLAHGKYIDKAFAQVIKLKQHRTKKGQLMAFVTVADETYQMELVIMPNLYANIMNSLVVGKYIYFSGKIDKEDTCLANKISVERNF